MLRAPTVGRHNSTAVDEEKRAKILSRQKIKGTNGSGDGGEELPI